MKQSIIRILLALVVSTASASAATVFSNLGQSNQSGETFTTSSSLFANDFLTDASARTITSTTLSMRNLDTIAHTFTVSLFTDNGAGAPGTLVGTFSSTITIGANASTPADYTVNSTGINLAANTAYWEVAKMNENTASSTPSWRNTSSQTADGGSVFSLIASTQMMGSIDNGATWSNASTGNTQFSLDGIITVPEPSRALLLLMGVAGLAMRRRR